MFNKKFIIIISIIVLAAAGFLSYKYLGKKPESPEQFLERQLVFNIKRQDLPSQAAELYKKEFDETAGNLRKNPDSLNDWVDLGVIKKIIGDLEGAETAWLKASEVNPQNSLSFANLGDLYGFYLNQPQKNLRRS